MTMYRLEVKTGIWERMTWFDLTEKMKKLIEAGVLLVDVSVSSEPESKPPPEVRMETRIVRRYVCSLCGFESSKIGVAIHRRVHNREVVKVTR